MKNYRTVSIVLIFLILLSVSAQAQVIPGRWEKVEALTLGLRITLELKNGDRTEGQFGGLSPSELSLFTGSAQAAIPRADIDRITTRESDPLTNGTLIGTGIGAGIGLGHAIAVTGVEGEEFVPVATVLSLIWTGIGALAGWGLDAIIWKEIVLYQAP